MTSLLHDQAAGLLLRTFSAPNLGTAGYSAHEQLLVSLTARLAFSSAWSASLLHTHPFPG